MASGDTLMLWNAASNKPPATNAASVDTRNQHWVLDFDATTNEDAIFAGVMPQHYAGTTGVTVRFGYSLTSATTGNTDWDIAFERIGDEGQDVDADGFAAVNSVDNTTVPGTSGHVDVLSITFTDGADMDSVVAGDQFRLKITRDAAADTAAGDAELHWVEIQET